MDVFNIGSRFGEAGFFRKLYALFERLCAPDAFLTDEDMSALTRLLPLRAVWLDSCAGGGEMYRDVITQLPSRYRRVIAVVDGHVALALSSMAVFLVHDARHWSAVVVDLIDRVAHHFDSNPASGHARLARQMGVNLHSCGIIDDPEMTTTMAFNQRQTQCGLFVLLIARTLDDALREADGGTSRADMIATAMHNAADDDIVVELRQSLARRVHHALLIAYNARAEAGDVESADQRRVLGELCCRSAARALLTRGEPTTAQLVCTLDALIPRYERVMLHTQDADVAVLGAASVAAIRSASLCVVAIRDARTDTIAAVALVVNRGHRADMETNQRPLLFTSANAARLPAMAACIEALDADARRRTHRFARCTSPVVLPVLILAWWAEMGRVVDMATLGDEVDRTHEILAACGVDDVRVDWFFRQMISQTFDAGHEALSALENEVDQTDPVVAVRVNLCAAISPVVIAAEQIRALNDDEKRINARISEERHRVVSLIRRFAPQRWRRRMDAATIRSLYYRMARENAAHQRIVLDEVHSFIRLCREATATVYRSCGTSVVEPFAVTVIDALCQQWPALWIADGVAVRASSPTYNEALSRLLDDPSPHVDIYMCPVAVCRISSTENGTTCAVERYISMFDLPAEVAAGKILPTAPDLLGYTPTVDLAALGGYATMATGGGASEPELSAVDMRFPLIMGAHTLPSVEMQVPLVQERVVEAPPVAEPAAPVAATNMEEDMW